MVVTDPVVLNGFSGTSWVMPDPEHLPLGLKPAAALHYGAAAVGALFVVVAGFALARRSGRGAAKA
jgi:hypothetical protein